MCEPMTIATVGAMAIGTGISIYAKQQQGAAESKMAENNAKLARWQAEDATRQGAEDAAQVRSEGSNASAAATAAMAASGVETTTGSGATAIAAPAVDAAIAANNARTNAARRAWGYENESQDLSAQARMIRHGTFLGSVGQGLSGAASTASTGVSMWKAMR